MFWNENQVKATKASRLLRGKKIIWPSVKWEPSVQHDATKLYKLSTAYTIVNLLSLWQYRLWSFKSGDTTLGIFLAKYYWILKIGLVSKSAKIWPAKSIFYVKNHWNLSEHQNTNLRAHFLLSTIFDNIQFSNDFIF